MANTTFQSGTTIASEWLNDINDFFYITWSGATTLAAVKTTLGISSFAETFLDDLTAADVRATLGLEIGTDVQAYAANLTTWAGVTPGTGVATALAINIGSAGAPALFNGDLGTPSAVVLTNASGTAANLTAGLATSLAGGAGGQVPYQSAAGVTTLLANGTAGQVLSSNGTTLAPSWIDAGVGDMILANAQTVTGAKTFGSAGAVGKLKIAGATSGSTILDATAVAGSGTVTLPTTGTLATLAGSEVFTNKTLTSPTLTTPVLGTPTSGNLANCTFPTLNQNTTGSSASCTGNAATVTTVTASQVGTATAGLSAGGVGTYAMLRFSSLTNASPGSTHAGSGLRWSNAIGSGSNAPSGTWMLLGDSFNGSAPESTSMFLRIS